MSAYTWEQYRFGAWSTRTRHAELRPCGTVAAYKRHRRRGERVDQACREAATAARLERRIRATRGVMSYDDDDCPFCWGTGQITVMEPPGGDAGRAVVRPCPEGCLAPEEVPF